MAKSLIEFGWSQLTGAISAELVAALIGAASEPWHPLPEEEGGAGVRQAGFSSFVPFHQAGTIVQHLGNDITEALNGSLVGGTPGVPGFNEVQWTKYPADIGYITPHRDPLGCGGVIAIATLTGQAAFSLGGRGEPISATWDTAPGDLVILQGNGWPSDDSRCPMHGVGPPRSHERIIMTLRHNLGGAGADYFS